MPSASRPFLSLRHASFLLGDRRVFPDTNWTFQEGEHWAVLGANGSGKSLFGDALRGGLPLATGELIYHFRAPRGLAHEDAIGHVSFDERKQDLHQAVLQSRWNSIEEETASTVTESLSYERLMQINPFEIRPNEKAERRKFAARQRRAFELLHIEGFRSRTLLSLSNGERQRVELARALCRPLRLLILDEPFAGLDDATRRNLGTLLEELMSTRLRVLLITIREQDLPSSITHVLEVSGCSLAGVRSASRSYKKFTEHSPVRPRNWCNTERAQVTESASDRGEANGPILIELKDVTVRYGDRVILDSISWEVREHESWALLGANGSGKSTLLGLITGDNPQVYSNQVRTFGRQRDGESVWELRHRIGYTSPELHVHFDGSASCLEVVASGFAGTVGLFEKPTASQVRAARAALRSFGLSGTENTPLFGVSNGLQRLVLLARALVNRPRLLLLDEPCQGLDQAHREQFIATINRLILKKQTTVIYVTHRSDELPPAINRVFRLEPPVAQAKRRVNTSRSETVPCPAAHQETKRNTWTSFLNTRRMVF